MTERIYQYDSYIKEFQAVVKNILPAEFAKELVAEIETAINREVSKARDVSTRILDREEAFAIPDLIRTKINLLPQAIQEVRVVEIAGLDLQADGGTHVSNTSEVGALKVAAYKSKGAINKRIYLEVSD
jgi:misacylated tRNA(Ala) deacylase